MLKKTILITFLLLVLTACAQDPRKEAQAFAIQSQAEQDALAAQQNRVHAEQLHEVELQRLAMEQENERASQPQIQLARSRAIWAGSLTLITVLCFSIISIARTVNKTVEGVGAAYVRRVEVASNLIRLDPVTRQFPLLIQHIHGTKYALHNPNLGSVVMLDTSKDADRQLIATSGATQIAGVMSQEARQSNDPAGMAIINPPIVDVQQENDSIRVGKSILDWSQQLED